MPSPGIPLTHAADRLLLRLSEATGAAAIRTLRGETLLGERAMLAGSRVPGRLSSGGGSRLFDALDGAVALNLARPADRELLPALFESAALDPTRDDDIAAHIAACPAAPLVARGREMGLAIAHDREPATDGTPALTCLVQGAPRPDRGKRPPRVIDLSSLWAGPLAGHLLWLAGAEVVKVESRTRPDGMRGDPTGFFALLNQGKASVVVDLADPEDRARLVALIRSTDIVIEAARPRALAQLGVDAAALVRDTPGLIWISITAHGVEGDAGNWVGFGDDIGVAAGLSAALRDRCGAPGFVGDAIADPLSGLFAALAAWNAYCEGTGGRFGVTMRAVVAQCLEEERSRAPQRLAAELAAWGASRGAPFPRVERRPIGSLASFGRDTNTWLPRLC